MSEAVFRIDGEDYPIPTRFKLGDSLLVPTLCGIEFDEFAARIDAMNDARDSGETKTDIVALAGLVGIAVRQKHPDWDDRKITLFVREIDFDTFETVGGQEDATAVPPAEETGSIGPTDSSLPPEGSDSQPSSNGSTTSPELSVVEGLG